MRCPSCGKKARKVALDRYWCAVCHRMWLIHRLTAYPPPEEAEK